MKYKLSLKPVARSRNGVLYGTGPTMLYEVDGLPEGQKISICNERASGQEPVWQVGGHISGQPTKWTGAFKTPEEALTQLQKEIDAANDATREQVERVANSVGWRRIPCNDQNVILFELGPEMVRVRMKDGNWAFYAELTDGKSPDKWGKDFPSLFAFFSSHNALSKNATSH